MSKKIKNEVDLSHLLEEANDALTMRVFAVTLRGISWYSQSRKYVEKVAPSKAAEYDAKHWRDKMHVNDDGLVTIPGTGLKQAIEAAAKLSGDKVEGRGNSKWGGIFISGIMIESDFVTNIVAKEVEGKTFSCDAKGNRGDYSSTRVDRTFPMFKPGWTAQGTIYILNPEITHERLLRYFVMAGVMIGIGRFRPSKGGHNGRFEITRFVETTP